MKILIIDDDAAVRKILCLYLAHLAAVVMEAADGAEGLASARREKPDLIISDALMPNMDGFELLREIRRSADLCDIPFIFYSAVYTGGRDKELARSLGADAFLEKPLGPDEFRHQLEELLKQPDWSKRTVSKKLLSEDGKYLQEYNQVVTARLKVKVQELELAGSKLILNEERFRATLEMAAVGIAHVNLDGTWLMVNQKLCDIVGYSREELLTKTFQEITHPDDLEADLDRVQQMMSGKIATYSMEKRYIHKNGSLVWINLTVSMAHDDLGQPKFFISIIEDISDRKHAEEELLLSKERYRAFVAQSSEAICLFELEHAPVDTTLTMEVQIDALYAQAVIRECNLTFAVSHGYGNPEEMIGFRIGQIFPQLAKENVDYLRTFIQGGYNIAHLDTKELTRNGTVKYFLNSLLGHVVDGRLLRVWSTKQDISRIKQAEEVILKLNEELEVRIRERTAQLEVANKELEAFCYSVAHDLRAPLRAIDGYTRMLVEDYDATMDAEGKRICSVISESATDMGKLIDDLLAFSRVGRTDMQPLSVDMAAIARSIFFEVTTPEVRERIDFTVGPLPSAVCDPNLIRQVWRNLLSNAVKFSSKTESAVITVTAGMMGAEMVYSIADNGVGFDMQYVNKLFGVFQRLHSLKEFEGTGVGLAIVQRIILRHGGRVWAEGKPGKGAVFHFTIK